MNVKDLTEIPFTSPFTPVMSVLTALFPTKAVIYKIWISLMENKEG